mmetsp:Transcript_10658/g.17952  ORF Transcript_10658/g.17952 Transcript_10658/m.17952 type:complete len:86 (-) Transcript_10658:89-346(-)
MILHRSAFHSSFVIPTHRALKGQHTSFEWPLCRESPAPPPEHHQQQQSLTILYRIRTRTLAISRPQLQPNHHAPNHPDVNFWNTL